MKKVIFSLMIVFGLAVPAMACHNQNVCNVQREVVYAAPQAIMYGAFVQVPHQNFYVQEEYVAPVVERVVVQKQRVRNVQRIVEVERVRGGLFQGLRERRALRAQLRADRLADRAALRASVRVRERIVVKH